MKSFARSLSVVTLCAGLLAAGCGGGGGGSAPAPAATVTVPTDTATIVSTSPRQSVQAAVATYDPNAGAVSPRSLGRSSSRAVARTLNTVTSNLDSLNGTVGETFTITYTNEPSNGCTLNGTLNGTVAAASSSLVSITLAGTLNYTACTNMPNTTATITNGSLSAYSTGQMVMTLPTAFAFAGETYTLSITITHSFTKNGSKYYLAGESYTGSDSLSNTFNFSYSHSGFGPYSYTNKNVVGGTTNDITCSMMNNQATCGGTVALSNGITLSYDSGDMTMGYALTNNSSGDTVAYSADFTSMSSFYSSNTGYRGYVLIATDGSGTAALNTNAGERVANLSWSATGQVTCDYVDPTMTDTTFYKTNIDQALNG